MMSDWSILNSYQTTSFTGITLDRILDYCDGPCLAAFKVHGERYLGTACDEDTENGTRWLLVPVSRLEMASMILGDQCFFDAFAGKNAMVLDQKDAVFSNAWFDIAFDLLPSDALPDATANFPELPDGVKAEWLTSVHNEVNALIVDGADAENLWSFRCMSKVMDRFQSLWDAIWQDVSSQPTQVGSIPADVAARSRLCFQQAFTGSMGISFTMPDKSAAQQIIEYYRKLIVSLRSKASFYEHCQNIDIPPRVRSMLSKLVLEMGKLGVDVLIRVDQQGAYLGRQRTGWLAKKKTVKEEVGTETVTVIGELLGLEIEKNSFTFKAEEDGEEGEPFTGKLSLTMRDEQHTVGLGTRYRATIAAKVDGLELMRNEAVLERVEGC